MQKNTAGQKWMVFAFNRTTNAPVTGDAANITSKVRKDYGAATAVTDTNPTELESGYYEFDFTQAETNADVLDLIPVSATADVQVIAVPGRIFTVPAGGVAGATALDNVNVSVGSIISALGGYTGISGDDLKTHLTTVATNVTTLLNRLGAFTGSGVNTVLGFLRALMRKDVGITTPSDVGGTFSHSTDSLEAVKDHMPASPASQTKLDELHDNRITSTRAGYLDKLNITGLAASTADIAAITQAQRVRIIIPQMMERPDSGSITYRLWIYSYNEQHRAEDLDSIPTVTAENNAGVDRSSGLGTVTKPGGTVGQYYVDYTVAVGHAIEGLVFKVDAIEGGETAAYAAASIIVDTTAVDFTAADRAKLDTLHDTRLTAGRAANLDNLDAAISSRLSTAGYTTPPTATEVRDEILNRVLVPNHVVEGSTAKYITEARSAAQSNSTAISNVMNAVASLLTAYEEIPASGGFLRLTAGALTQGLSAGDVATAIGTRVVEGTTTYDQSMRLINAANAGLASGAGTPTFTLRDLANTKDRVVATTDVAGNRSAVILDLS